MWHPGYGDTPLGIYLSKNIHKLKSYHHDFQVCHKAASIWWTCPYNNNLMKHVTWKRTKCNVMKKKTISSTRYICHNKQLKNSHKFMPMSINQQIIILSIQKKLQILTFFRFSFNFWTQNYGLWRCLCLLQSPVVFPA